MVLPLCTLGLARCVCLFCAPQDRTASRYSRKEPRLLNVQRLVTRGAQTNLQNTFGSAWQYEGDQYYNTITLYHLGETQPTVGRRKPKSAHRSVLAPKRCEVYGRVSDYVMHYLEHNPAPPPPTHTSWYGHLHLTPCFSGRFDSSAADIYSIKSAWTRGCIWPSRVRCASEALARGFVIKARLRATTGINPEQQGEVTEATVRQQHQQQQL